MRVLLIAPKCYPIEGAESIVNIKMLQAFSKYDDIIVDVVSRDYDNGIYPSDELHEYGVRIEELRIIKSINKLNIKTAWQTIKCFTRFQCGFKGCVWAYVALPIVKELISKHHYDFVLTKNSPSFLIGSYLHKKGIPWVASWNDPYPVGFYPAPYGKDSDHKPTLLEQLKLRQMRKADYHVFPSQRLLEHMLSYLHVDNKRCRVIPHAVIPIAGFESTLRIASEENDFTMRIIHSGNLSNPRDPTTFFTAIDNVLKRHSNYHISVTVLGRVDEKVLPTDKKYTFLNRCITLIPSVEYNQALHMLIDYDLACVIEANTLIGKAVFLPTKVTDFMQIGIPVMSISPREGVLNDLYRKGNIGYFCDVSDIVSIEKEIEKAYSDFVTKGLKGNIIDKSFLPDGIVAAYREIAFELANPFHPVAPPRKDYCKIVNIL